MFIIWENLYATIVLHKHSIIGIYIVNIFLAFASSAILSITCFRTFLKSMGFWFPGISMEPPISRIFPLNYSIMHLLFQFFCKKNFGWPFYFIRHYIFDSPISSFQLSLIGFKIRLNIFKIWFSDWKCFHTHDQLPLPV